LISALDQFEPYVQKLISRIPKDGSTVDLQHLFHQLSMDTSTDFILEHGTNYLGGDEKAAMIDDNINKCLEHGAWREMLGPLRFLLPNREARKALKAAHAELDVWVKQAMEHKDSADLEDGKAKDSGKRYVFINELARHKEVDAVRIRDEVMNIILAGKDTTASCLSGLWFVLAREPEIYKKLQAEVAELNGERPTYESLRNMKYIKHTVQEGEDIPNPTSLPH
jgi:cytochrome P450